MLNSKNNSGLINIPDSVPMTYLTRIMEVMMEHGKDINPYLKTINMPFAQLSNPEISIPSKSYYTLLENLLKDINIPAFGYKVGRKFSIVDYGLLSYATISCANILESLKTFFHFQAIVGAYAEFDEFFDVQTDTASITLNSPLVKGDVRRFEVELFLAQWASVADAINLSGIPFQFSKVNVSFEKPDYADIFYKDFQCPVNFNQNNETIFLRREQLNQQVQLADEASAQFCRQQCEMALKNLQKKHGFEEKVRRLIIKHPAQILSPEQVAEQLGMSYRTLRRRLSEEGTSFREINDEIRMGMACEYLTQTEFTIQEIAFLLGYSEVANFHHAFKKWSQLTPGDYRTQKASPK